MYIITWYNKNISNSDFEWETKMYRDVRIERKRREINAKTRQIQLKTLWDFEGN